MKNVVVAIREADDCRHAVERVIELARSEPARVHLLTVRAPLSQYVTRFLPAESVRALHDEEGRKVLEPAARMLERAGIAHQDHVRVGYKAELIVRFAREFLCDKIVLCERPAGLIARLQLGTIAGQIRHLLQAAHPGCEVV